MNFIYTSLNEYLNNGIDSITIYHGTLPKKVSLIKRYGLKDKSGYHQGWYMVSTDFESALFHATPDDKNDFVYVFEFKIPIINNDRWVGYPYLWKGMKRSENSTWFALKDKIPNDFITKIHKIPIDDWRLQKQKGF